MVGEGEMKAPKADKILCQIFDIKPFDIVTCWAML